MRDYRISYIVARDGVPKAESEVFPCERSAREAVDHLGRVIGDGELLRVVNVWVFRDGRWEIVGGWEAD